MDDLSILWLILAAALATYATRVGGYVLITRMRTLPPRLEQALNAVPAAVLTTLWAPAFFTNGWDVRLALIAAALVSLRYPGLIMLAAGWAAAMLARHLFGL
ncbi:putative membrane protein [Devosia subaequoris]|uniref:Putative membrane protein n=1 Tax=Devosia subaequoris TaxID=395930 RepID=A0A7W6IMA6_9HYPH|nr:AzlD domain-containing protein [Devosia subaequoris]MBB4051772.1 putative membrane protein [Devosia subaequoris]MCP1210931.1 AzlD domain-containing protein [Devosia subaequoris]